MAIIPNFILDAVVALGINIEQNKKLWIGTGFLVGRKEQDDPTKSTVYLVTNKHVVANQKQLIVRFNKSSEHGVQDLELALDDGGNANYSAHPNGLVDVVAIQILPNVIVKNHLSLHFIDKDDHALSLSEMEKTGVNEGSLVYALGFPMNLVDDSTKAPLCRLGCVSRIADAFISAATAPRYLVDVQTFPGNSGGPIISRPEAFSIEGTPHNASANLIGILSAYIPYQDTLISQQTRKAHMVLSENSGLTIVHPVDRIREVIEMEWHRKESLKARLLEKIKKQAESTPHEEAV